MLVKVKDPAFYGKQHSLPDIGYVAISEVGEVDVPDYLADLLVNNTSDWNYSGADASVEEDPSVKLTEDLQALTLVELVEMAQGAGIESKELSKRKKSKTLMMKWLLAELLPLAEEDVAPEKTADELAAEEAKAAEVQRLNQKVKDAEASAPSLQ